MRWPLILLQVVTDPTRPTASAETTALSPSAVSALLPLSPCTPRDRDVLCNSMHTNVTTWAEKCVYSLSTKPWVETPRPELQLAVMKSSWKSLMFCTWGSGLGHGCIPQHKGDLQVLSFIFSLRVSPLAKQCSVTPLPVRADYHL